MEDVVCVVVFGVVGEFGVEVVVGLEFVVDEVVEVV